MSPISRRLFSQPLCSTTPSGFLASLPACPDGPAGSIYVTIPACEVKNGHELTFALSRHTTDIIDLYLARFRPRLADSADPWLFPGFSGTHKNVFVLSSQIQATVFDWTGLRLTPNQFRHLAAKLIIDAEPGAYELVRLLLGHRRLLTTTLTYRVVELGDGMRRYDQLLAGLSSANSRAMAPQGS